MSNRGIAAAVTAGILSFAVVAGAVGRTIVGRFHPDPRSYAETAPAQGDLIAFSLKQAETCLTGAGFNSDSARHLGGITRLAGLVYDKERHDLIVVGQIESSGAAPVTLDDLAVAFRAVLPRENWPAVSIEFDANTAKTNQQWIMYKGPIEHTRFGLSMINSDIILKQASLAMLNNVPDSVGSYFGMCAATAKSGRDLPRVHTRWWFEPTGIANTTRAGVCAISSLSVGLRAETFADKSVNSVTGEQPRDPEADAYAERVLSHYGDLGSRFPDLLRLKSLFDATLLAAGAADLAATPDLTYWLKQYPVQQVETPAHYPLLEKAEPIFYKGRQQILSIHGGIRLKPLIIRLESGDITALRTLCLAARPSPTALTWRIPHGAWTIPGSAVTTTKSSRMEPDNYGFSTDRIVAPLGQRTLQLPTGPAFVPNRIPDFGASVRYFTGSTALASPAKPQTRDLQPTHLVEGDRTRPGGVRFDSGASSVGKGGANLRDSVLGAWQNSGEDSLSVSVPKEGAR